MGIIERKEKEKQDLRKRILDAAMQVFLEKGYEDTSIRNIAERVEYSPTTLYLYFKDKDAIFLALHDNGFCILNEKMTVLQYVSDPFERLKAMGRIYIEFALNNKELYDLMFMRQAPLDAMECDDEQEWKQGQTAFDGLKLTIAGCMEMGYMKHDSVEIAAFVVWSAIHGMCALHIANRCMKVMPDLSREEIVNMGYESYIRMLEAMKAKA